MPQKHQAPTKKKTEPVQYNDQLLHLLSQITASGKFAFTGSVNFVDPELQLTDVGLIQFPLSDKQAKDISKVSSAASYGILDKTIFDPRIRTTWQVDADKVTLTDSAKYKSIYIDLIFRWNKTFQSILEKVASGLGIHTGVTASLYKLLLYDKGGFFKPHRDSEKEKHMFGTLVVQLPCSYEGGNLIVVHRREKITLDMREKSDEKINFAAFFADCQHEIMPVTSGYRLCLVYNLLHEDSTQGSPKSIPRKLSRDLLKLLEQWKKDPSSPKKLVLELDHQYTEFNLSWNGLKGRDRETVNLFKEMQVMTEFKMELCIIKYHQKGYPTDQDHPSEISSTYEDKLHLVHWIHMDGTVDKTRNLVMKENKEWVGFSNPKDIHGRDADGKRTWISGNEGTILEKWYNAGALVLWKPGIEKLRPRKRARDSSDDEDEEM